MRAFSLNTQRMERKHTPTQQSVKSTLSYWPRPTKLPARVANKAHSRVGDDVEGAGQRLEEGQEAKRSAERFVELNHINLENGSGERSNKQSNKERQ